MGVADFDGLDRILSDAGDGLPKVGELRERITDIVGRGEAADGRIAAEYTSAGGLSALELDPRALRLGSEELSREIKTAVNAAASDFRDQVTQVSGALFGSCDGSPDPADAGPFRDPSAALAQVEKIGNAFAGQMKDLLRELAVQQQRTRQAAEGYQTP